MQQNKKLEKIAADFILCCETADFDTMRNLMQPNAKSYITNAEGGVNLFDGRDALIQNLIDLDVKNVKPKIQIDQILSTAENQVMIMFEGYMKKANRIFHNTATYLIDFKNDLIDKIQMVEANPASSDEFWKN